METVSALSEEALRERIVGFIAGNYLLGDTERIPQEDESFMGKGIIDSTGILELIEFVETEFGVEIGEEETLPENLDSISNLVGFIRRKSDHA